MPLANQFMREFDAITRAGGSEDFEHGLGCLEILADRGAGISIATRPASIVSMDWALAESFGIHCTCSAFQKEFCHHAWTALLVFDASEEAEIIDARMALETQKLKLRKMPEGVLRDPLPLASLQAWPLVAVAPSASLEFRRDGNSYRFSGLLYQYGDVKVLATSDRKEFLDRASQRRVKRNLSAEKALLKSGGFI